MQPGCRAICNQMHCYMQVIRDELNSSLPVEVFYFGETEYDAQIVALLEVGLWFKHYSGFQNPNHRR